MSAVSTSRDFLPEQGAVFDLSARAKLRMTGADRLRYLNGQITNDLRKATETSAIHACVLSAKGKINAEVFVAMEGEAFIIDSDPGMSEPLTARLDRYIIADDVQLEDVTQEFALLHVIGGAVPELPVAATRRQASRFGMMGTDLWMNPSERERALQELARTLSICDAVCAETFRIERGLPRWGHELTDAIIPNEANLEASAIDYAKGCYIGQEVISRIKMSGQTNKRLCGFVAEGEVPLREGMRLTAPGGEAKEVGWLTSVAFRARVGGQIALGFVKRGSQGLGTCLEARASDAAEDSSPALAKITALPFA